MAIDQIHNGQGKPKEPVLKPVNAVVTTYLEEDKETGKPKQTIALLLRVLVQQLKQIKDSRHIVV